MTYVLDASAVVAFFKKEEGKEKVWDILQEAENRTASVYMSKVNLTEVNYRFICLLGMEGAAVILNKTYKLPIQMIDTITNQVFEEASRLKGTYKMSLGDAIGLSTAITLKGLFVSSDGELKEPEAGEHAPIFWFRPPKEKPAKPPRRTLEQAERELAAANRRIAELEANTFTQ